MAKRKKGEKKMSDFDLKQYVPYILVVGGIILAFKYSFWVLLGVVGYAGWLVYSKYFKKD